jgi:hypothetical protein
MLTSCSWFSGPDQVVGRERPADLLQSAAFGEATQIDDEKPRVPEQRARRVLGLRIITGDEHDALALGLAGVFVEHGRGECVGGLHDPCAGHQFGDNLT